MSLMESIRSSLTHLHGFQLLCCCHSSSLFFTEITFFRLHQTDKSSESKVKFRHASNRCKRVLEAPKLAYANKTKESITSLALTTFGKLQIVFSTKVNLLYLPYSMAWRCCLLHLIKQNCLLKTFLRTLILMIQVSPYLFSLLKLV